MTNIRVKRGDDREWEVWFEDFWVVGTGATRRAALMRAQKHVAELAIEVEQELLEELARPAAQE